jgi:kynurenine formamidase
MTDLSSLAASIVDGSVQVIDLTSPLHSGTPVLALPPDFGQTAVFELEEISRYDDRGPAWYWNNVHTGEHTGTHVDAPIHWVTGQDKDDVSQIPVQRLVGPVIIIDKSVEVAAYPDY